MRKFLARFFEWLAGIFWDVSDFLDDISISFDKEVQERIRKSIEEGPSRILEDKDEA